MANAFGRRFVPDWESEVEWDKSPTEKIKVLAAALHIPTNELKPTWDGIVWLGKFRNRIAHPKPEEIREELSYFETDDAKRAFDIPESKLEREITIGNARRAVKTVDDIKLPLFNYADPDNRDGFVCRVLVRQNYARAERRQQRLMEVRRRPLRVDGFFDG